MSDLQTSATITNRLESEFKKAMSLAFGMQEEDANPMIRLTADAKFGDFQSNAAMGIAKTLKKPPREVAQAIVDKLQSNALIETLEIAGPGFINITLKNSVLTELLLSWSGDARLGVAKATQPIHHVIDFSSPNLAKEMHVGHLRTTITGEVISRIIEFKGHSIERINHVGDWGTQFGMLLEFIYESEPDVLNNPENFKLSDLESFYKKAKARFDSDEVFADKARQKVVLLQSGDATALSLWRTFLKESLRHCHELYKVLGVTLKDVGESFYNDRLGHEVEQLLKSGLAQNDNGAVCVFLDGFVNRDGEPLPMIVRKSDGGFNYSTTDIAAIRYRIFEQKAKRLIYVTDLRQEHHFSMLFALARKAGWAGADVDLQHIGYGMVLGEDKRPFKTRDGGTVRLRHLIDESIERARQVIQDRSFSDEERDTVARTVGLAAIKYADLSHNLSSDYVFNWDKMLAMEGNTGPYMLYAYARIRSIGRKGQVDFDQFQKPAALYLEHSSERALAFELSKLSDVIHEVSLSLKPNHLTDYLYSLSKAFSTFYDKKSGVSVLDAESEALRQSRLYLCSQTARALKLGLNLLSLDVLEKM